MRTSIQICGLLLITTVTAQSAENERKPVVMKVTTGKVKSDGGQELQIKLTIARKGFIYANPPGSKLLRAAATTVRIQSKNGKPVPCTVIYPKGKKIIDNVVGNYHIYEGEITIRATIQKRDPSKPLILKCHVSGSSSIGS